MSYPEKSQLNLQTVVRDLEKRLEAIEGKLWPSDDGSGTERYADNWTQVSDGKDYPGSYGVGDTSKPLVPFAPTDEERANAGQAPEVGSQAESPKAY